jgi:hypothetical protein
MIVSQAWEDAVLEPAAPPSSVMMQRYLAHNQHLCSRVIQHVATGGQAKPEPAEDPRLVPIGGVDCLNMGDDPKGMRVSLVLHFYPHFFKIDSQPFVHDYSRANKRLLLAIHRGRLPLRLMNEKGCTYYNGCVLVELRDYRGVAVARAGRQPGGGAGAGGAGGSASGVERAAQHKLVVSRVLLQPAVDSILDDLVRTRTRSHTSRLLSLRDTIEAEKFLVNGSHTLCLDPSPRVATVAGALHYNAHKLDPILEKLSPLLPDSYSETTYHDARVKRYGGAAEHGGKRARLRRPVQTAGGVFTSPSHLDWTKTDLIKPNLELLKELAPDTGSGLPHGAVVLLKQKLYTTRQWSRAETSYNPYKSAQRTPAHRSRPSSSVAALSTSSSSSQHAASPPPLFAPPPDAATPEEVLEKSSLVQDADVAPPRTRRHLREQRYANRDQNHFYIIDLFQNEDKSCECVIRCGATLGLCSHADAETHAVTMPSLDALYNFARQFARLKHTEGCLCVYDSMRKASPLD